MQLSIKLYSSFKASDRLKGSARSDRPIAINPISQQSPERFKAPEVGRRALTIESSQEAMCKPILRFYDVDRDN